jgi:predicted TIM-barrel fold metal-dependent hydrolase
MGEENQTIAIEQVIDADIHPRIVNGLNSLRKYMSRSARERFECYSNLPSFISFPPFPGGSGDRRDVAPPNGAPGTDPHYIKETYLDKYNIKYGVTSFLQASIIAGMHNRHDANIIASATNDYALNEWHSVDDRLRVAMIVSPHEPAAAAKEIHRIGNEKGVAAVYLPLTNLTMGKEHYYPIYEAAIEHGLPLFIHPAGTEGGHSAAFQLGGGVPGSYTERHTRFVEVGYANLASMVFEGVFERYPELKVVLCEFGFSWLPNIMWKMDQNWREFRYEIPWVKKAPSEYVLKNVRFTTQPLEEPPKSQYLYQILEMIDAENTMIFSSDYPHWDFDEPNRTLTKLPKEVRRKIFYQNAFDVFRFE